MEKDIITFNNLLVLMETDDSLEYSSGLDLTNNSVFLSHLKQDDDDIVVIEENF